MKHPYGIGLDIGIASVGWAVVALNENAEPYGLIRCGSRIFDKAEQPKTGDSLAAPRREARSAQAAPPQPAQGGSVRADGEKRSAR